MSSEVSVLIPSYNHAPFVERCLRSIFKQTLPPKKLLVIDDGSRDDSVKVIERVLQDCPFPSELISRPNKGLCATLNEGFPKLEGEYFAYLGSDDVWSKDFLAARIELLESRPNAVLAFGHSFLVDKNDQIFDCTEDWTNFADGDMLPLLLRGVVMSSPTVVYRRKALDSYTWNENSILEDYELYLQLTTEGEFAFDKKVLSAWRIHGENVSGDFEKMMNEWLAAQNRQAEKLKISKADLEKIQTELKFKCVAEFIRTEKKQKAFELFRQNLTGAKSSAEITKMLFRLAIPSKIFAWNRAHKRENAIKKYGKLGF